MAANDDHLATGDLVEYRGKNYYFQSNGNTCYLYNRREDVGNKELKVAAPGRAKVTRVTIAEPKKATPPVDDETPISNRKRDAPITTNNDKTHKPEPNAPLTKPKTAKRPAAAAAPTTTATAKIKLEHGAPIPPKKPRFHHPLTTMQTTKLESDSDSGSDSEHEIRPNIGEDALEDEMFKLMARFNIQDKYEVWLLPKGTRDGSNFIDLT